jgi:hypothetical protein
MSPRSSDANQVIRTLLEDVTLVTTASIWSGFVAAVIVTGEE